MFLNGLFSKSFKTLARIWGLSVQTLLPPAKLSGDVIVIPTPGTISRGKTGTTHGSAYSYDTHVPILFYGAGIKNGLSHKDYNVRDIAPTLATLLGVELTNGNSGRVIEEVLE